MVHGPHEFSATCYRKLKEIPLQSNQKTNSNPNGVNKAVSLGFYYPSTRLIGVPEREDTLLLKNTGSNPYQLFATD